MFKQKFKCNHNLPATCQRDNNSIIIVCQRHKKTCFMGRKSFNSHGGERSGGAKDAHSANAVISCCSTFCRYTISCLRTCGLWNSHRSPECPSTSLPCQKDLAKGGNMNKGFKSAKSVVFPCHMAQAQSCSITCVHTTNHLPFLKHPRLR
jgi:hypothetical protein